jgi:hypothetical protein
MNEIARTVGGLRCSVANDYRNNHYVPEWYQRRIIPVDRKDKELHYLDLRAGYFVDSTGVCHPRRAAKRQGCRSCFVQKDLYTTRFGEADSVDVEKYFFGDIDNQGRHATDYFATFAHPSIDSKAIRALLRYMSTQKLRTPKGLYWLFSNTPSRTKNELLAFVQHLENLYGAIWCESIWQIADATDSPIKFIISDHSVTVYNRDCPPTSFHTRGVNDPDIRWHGTHTIFPLTLNKVLILTNLSWLRNPYQSARGVRPNPNLLRGAIFNFQQIQTLRRLSEDEVVQINYIIKRRALRYIAAADQQWLYPEAHTSIGAWRGFGDALLLMPDPRSVQFSGRIMTGRYDGSSSAWDEYGLRPWEQGFDNGNRSADEWETFHRFRGEFARRFGPQRRGRALHMVHLDPERDSEDAHSTNLRYETEYQRFTRVN